MAPSGNLELEVYFSKAKQGYTIRRMEKLFRYSIY
jgi:hypothetical protein